MATSTQQKAVDMSMDWLGLDSFMNTLSKQQSRQQADTDFKQFMDWTDSKIADTKRYQAELYDQQKKDTAAQNDLDYSRKLNEQNRAREDSIRQENNKQHQQMWQNAQVSQRGYSSGGSSSSTFGKGATPPSSWGTGIYGQRTFNDSAVRDWETRQAATIKSIRDASKAEMAGQIDLAEAQSRNQQNLLGTQNKYEMQRMQEESRLRESENSSSYYRQSQQNAADRASKERLANIEANSRLYSSMYSNYGNGGGFQYWGGRV